MRKHRAPLDDDTIERLLTGHLEPADAPPGYAATASLLSDAAATVPDEQVDHVLVGSMVQAIAANPSTTGKQPTMISKVLTAKVAALAAGALVATAGAAAAATGNLPAPAQDAVARTASHVGIDLPDSDGDHPTGNTTNPSASDDHGVDVSGTARSTDATGRDHGKAVSDVARDGHGRPETTTTTEATDDDAETETETHHGRPEDAGSQAPVTTPNPGGTGTADDASSGHSTAGTDHSASQSGRGSANSGRSSDDHPSGHDGSGSDDSGSDDRP
jgi:hypothetical protein